MAHLFEVSSHSRGFGKMDQVAVRLVLGCVLTMRRPTLDLNDQYAGVYFEAEVSEASLGVVAGVDAGAAVNLEKALRLADRLGGHLMSGHVDGTGTVAKFEAVGDNRRLVIEAPPAIARYIARKGSIAVSGVSLTVNAVDGNAFEVNLIAHTLSATTLQHLKPGVRVNLEVDMLARYIERLHEAGRSEQARN